MNCIGGTVNQSAPVNTTDSKTRGTPCSLCPLRENDCFRDFTEHELEFMKEFKTGELTVSKGATFLREGSNSPHLYTILDGYAFRYKLLEDGRRQILNYLTPGDLLGLQGTLMSEMEHSVEALTDMRLCVFERDRLNELYSNFPGLAYDLTWIAAREERILDEHLLSVGRRTAVERAAYLLAFFTCRIRTIEGDGGRQYTLPITQQHLADTLGLSIVHTNKTLKRLGEKGLIHWLDRGCRVLNVDGLMEVAKWDPPETKARPFL